MLQAHHDTLSMGLPMTRSGQLRVDIDNPSNLTGFPRPGILPYRAVHASKQSVTGVMWRLPVRRIQTGLVWPDIE